MSVDMVAEALFVSRRRLERKFQNILNRSVHKEIVRYRIEKVEQLLLNSDLTLTQIADKLQFTNYQQIDRYFKQYKGITPSEFSRRSRQFIGNGIRDSRSTI